jgi:hypothetical protein
VEAYPDPEGMTGTVVWMFVASVPVLVLGGALTTDVMVCVRRLVTRMVLSPADCDEAGGVGKP